MWYSAALVVASKIEDDQSYVPLVDVQIKLIHAISPEHATT